MTKRALETPLYSGLVLGKSVDFYRPQRGGPDFPWVDCNDLLIALGMGRQMRLHMQREHRDGPHGADHVLIQTERGERIAVPHYVAQGTIHAMVDLDQCSRQALVDYALAGARAASIVTAGKSPDEVGEFLAAAMARNESADATGKARVN